MSGKLFEDAVETAHRIVEKVPVDERLLTGSPPAHELERLRNHRLFDIFEEMSRGARSLLRDLPETDKLRVYAARILTAAEYGRRHLLDEMTARERPQRGKK